MTCTCTGGPYIEGAFIHEKECPHRPVTINEVRGILKGIDYTTPARAIRERVIDIVRAEISCARCERYGPPTEQDENGIFWHHTPLPSRPDDPNSIIRRECNNSTLHRILQAINDLPIRE